MGGGRANQKSLHEDGMDIFWNHAVCYWYCKVLTLYQIVFICQWQCYVKLNDVDKNLPGRGGGGVGRRRRKTKVISSLHPSLVSMTICIN